MADEDDWVGTPPEGHYTRDRADPAFWARRRWQAGIPALVILIAAIVIVVVVATR